MEIYKVCGETAGAAPGVTRVCCTVLLWVKALQRIVSVLPWFAAAIPRRTADTAAHGSYSSRHRGSLPAQCVRPPSGREKAKMYKSFAQHGFKPLTYKYRTG